MLCRFCEKLISSTLLSVLAILILPALTHAYSVSQEELVSQALSDIRVLYLFSEPREIDWPTLYYLNDKYGCRIDLLTFQVRSRFEHGIQRIRDREIFLHNFSIPHDDTLWMHRLTRDLFEDRRPDIAIFGRLAGDSRFEDLRSYLTELPADPQALFNMVKYYRLVEDPSASRDNVGTTVIMNGLEMFHKFEDRIISEVHELFPWYQPQKASDHSLVRYRLIQNRLSQTKADVDFVSGLETMRLGQIIDSLFIDGPKKTVLSGQAIKFVLNFSQSQIVAGTDKVDLVVDGYREISYLMGYQFGNEAASATDFKLYLADLHRRAERAALRTVGLNWQGRIIQRDSPHGPVVKFRVSLSADSPLEMEVSNVRFHPYWDSTTVLLDTTIRKIVPHQSFVREYLVDIDHSRLETKEPEEIMFSADVSYRKNSMTLTSSIPVWEAPELTVTFVPDFSFFPPIERLDIDRVVSAMNLKAVITKPIDYADSVRLHLETPRGLFAGSYRSRHYLDKGTTRQIVRIPFSVSGLFERGIHQQTIALLVDDRTVAVDTAMVRIASCRIADTVKIGFMPDSTGILEDILRMTDADFEVLTDRTLKTYDLSAYNVIIIGSGSLKYYPAFGLIKDRLENYIRQGGSIVLLGQPRDWPKGLLPVAFVPAAESVDNSEITNRIPEARILSWPYPISDKSLLSSFYKKKSVVSAVVSPAEVVYRTASGGALLSVSRLGDGQLIYCGLPLLEMISRLDIDAIHLFANIVNY